VPGFIGQDVGVAEEDMIMPESVWKLRWLGEQHRLLVKYKMM
jgi:hypothetical protein